MTEMLIFQLRFRDAASLREVLCYKPTYAILPVAPEIDPRHGRGRLFRCA